jgi:hypothetical protein
MRRNLLIGALTAGVLAAAAHVPLAAQDVTYTLRSEFKTGGAMDMLASLAGKMAGQEANLQRQYVKGRRMRTDEGKSSSTILDLEERRMYFLQHDQKNYVSMPLDSMAEAMRAMAEAMEGTEVRPAEAPGSGAPAMNFKVSVDRTGERTSIAGYSAEQVFITLEAEGVAAAAADPEGAPVRMVLLMETWLSHDVPGYQTLRALQEELGSEMSMGGGGEMGGAVLGMLTGTPGTQEGLERAAAEMKKLDGMTVRSATYVVTVPADQPFQRALVLNPPAREGIDVKQAAAKALGGLFGRKQQQQPEAAPEATLAQSTVLTLTQELVEVDTATLPASLFAVPAGYVEVRGDDFRDMDDVE